MIYLRSVAGHKSVKQAPQERVSKGASQLSTFKVVEGTFVFEIVVITKAPNWLIRDEPVRSAGLQSSPQPSGSMRRGRGKGTSSERVMEPNSAPPRRTMRRRGASAEKRFKKRLIHRCSRARCIDVWHHSDITYFVS